MPGIAGIVSRRPADECEQLVAAMVGSMAHERFYESGTCFVPELGVYAGWVAHPKPANARADNSPRGDVSVLLSGECFVDHVARGGTSRLDVDALVKLYDGIGEKMIDQLNGLFSGLLIDRRQQRALLFNDRYGVERIYVHEAGDAVYFASEAKALLRVVPALRAFDDEGVAQFLAFGCTLEGRTLFRGVRVLDGGSCWSFQRNECRKRRYFVPQQWESQSVLQEAAFEAEFEETFARILPRYVGTEPGLGISLTGGLDTRMIMACLPDRDSKPVCYTFSGLTERTLDERLAARIAAARGLDHHILRIQPHFLSQYGTYVDHTVLTTDGCSGATGAHEIHLNALARALAPVRLTGNFGSEVLRSMSTFKPLGLASDLLHGEFVQRVKAVGSGATAGSEHPVTFAAFREIPWRLFGTLAAGKSQVTFRTPYLDNDLVALAYRAPAHSRRTPHSALSLIAKADERLARIPTDRGVIGNDRGLAHVARRVWAEVTFKLDYLHKEGLPDSLAMLEAPLDGLAKIGVLGLHKYLPYRRWFRGELAPHVREGTDRSAHVAVDVFEPGGPRAHCHRPYRRSQELRQGNQRRAHARGNRPPPGARIPVDALKVSCRHLSPLFSIRWRSSACWSETSLRTPGCPHATWVPVIWFLIIGSRLPTEWLGGSPSGECQRLSRWKSNRSRRLSDSDGHRRGHPFHPND